MMEITLEERKTIQLEMLKEIDTFCRANGIRYSLTCGTLIGAIRHKGFIPWDDDVDIMMPLPDMLKFKESFRSEKLKYCDVDTEKHYGFSFSRIAFLPTYRKEGLIFKSYGVSIDLYPVVSIPSQQNEQDKYLGTVIKMFKKRMLYKRIRYKVIKYLPLTSIPMYDYIQKKYRDTILYNASPYGTTGIYYVIGGSPEHAKKRAIFDYDLFEQIIDVNFEGNLFCAISCFDKFLRHGYGDYMQLPPEDERHPYHGGKYYWK